MWTVLKAEIARSSLDCVDNGISVCNLERFWPWCDWCDLIGVNHSSFISMFLCWDSLYEWWTETLELIFFIYSTRIELILQMILHIGNPTDTRCSDYSDFSILTAWVFMKINDIEERRLTVYPSYLLISERLWNFSSFQALKCFSSFLPMILFLFILPFPPHPPPQMLIKVDI